MNGFDARKPQYPYGNYQEGLKVAEIFSHTENRRGPELIRCGGCNQTWTGVSRCHCSLCHRTMSSASAFNAHIRRGGEHVHPFDVGLELRGDIWGHPGPSEGVWS